MVWNNSNNRTSTSEWRKIRQQAKHTLPYQCAHCGDGEPLELDHIINHARGGTNELNNLQWLCKPCHKRKTQKEATAARNAWKRKPEKHPGAKK